MESALEWHRARALLEWQLEMGVDEAISDSPVDRFALEQAARDQAKARQSQVAQAPKPGAPVPKEVGPDPVVVAQQAAKAAGSLEALRAAMDGYEHCELKRGARSLVFADGTPGARVMIIGEAPGREEDRQGKPFVGAAGQLLDRMLEAIGLSRADSVYITNVLPWRPPQNRDPKPDEIAMLQPFLQRHIALAAPEVLILMGNISCQAMLGKRGISRLRGTWDEAAGRPALPMFHPAYLLRNPAAKAEAWADLLELQAKLRTKAQ